MDCISKELLSEVLDRTNIEEVIAQTNIVVFKTGDGNSYINIHELAFKCKEWAFNKDFELMSFKYDFNECGCFIDYDCQDTNKMYLSATEPEAIFKACEWIMEQNNG